MSVNTYRPYQEKGQLIDVAIVGYGGKTTFMDSFLGTSDSDIEREGSRVLEINGKRIVVRMSSHDDYLIENSKIGFVVCKMTDTISQNKVENLAEFLRSKKVQDIYILATHCDRRENRRIATQEQLSDLAKALNLKGVIEVNATDKKDVRNAVKEVVSSHFPKQAEPVNEIANKDASIIDALKLSKNASPSPVQKTEPNKEMTESERLKQLREAKSTPVQTPEPAKEEVKKTKVVLIKQSTFWSWFLNIFSCFGIFYTVVEPHKKRDIAPPDVKDF